MLLTLTEAGQALGVSRQRVSALVKTGRLTAIRSASGRAIGIDSADAAAFKRKPSGRPKARVD